MSIKYKNFLSLTHTYFLFAISFLGTPHYTGAYQPSESGYGEIMDNLLQEWPACSKPTPPLKP